MRYKLYECGGKIRDEFLGLKSKDIDYSVVIEPSKMWGENPDMIIVFNLFVDQLKKEGYKIFLETPKMLTIRAKFPENHINSGQDADFVIARKELKYLKDSRTPDVKLGTLRDDLIRRDFTINTLAKDLEGHIIDLFSGQKDLMDRILRTPTDAVISFNNDPLRLLRALRFSITKSLGFSDEIVNAIELFDADKLEVVSVERIREELFKMFRFDTEKSLNLLYWLKQRNYMIYQYILNTGIKLEPTLKK